MGKAVRVAIGVEGLHLFGQSFGGMAHAKSPWSRKVALFSEAHRLAMYKKDLESTDKRGLG